jgi:HSP20 family protein
MSLIRWNPSRDLATVPSELFNVQREMNRLFDNLFRPGNADDYPLTPSAWSPAVDVAESDTAFVVKMELPGVAKEDVHITMEQNVLSVKGEKKQEKESKTSDFHRIERSYGTFQRSFSLPSTVKADRIDATFRDGILNVTLPKAEESRPKEIEVKVK